MRRPLNATAIFAAVSGATIAPVQVLANDGTHAFEMGHDGPHIFEVFLGQTYADHHGQDEQAFSIGAQYRYAISHVMSVGVLAEYTDSPFDAWILGLPYVLNLSESPWQLTLMPGVELEGGEKEFLFRTGVGYEFERQGGYSIKPEINFDWVDGEIAVVAGASIGWRF